MDFSNYYLLQNVMSKNYHALYSDVAGLSRHSSKLHGLLFGHDHSMVSLDYLNNFCQEYQSDYEQCIADFSSKPDNYFVANNNAQREEIDEYTLYLPKPQKIKTSLDEVLFFRNSSNILSDAQIPLLKFSTLLFYAYGAQSSRQVPFGDNEITSHTRTYGSGGGLYPISVYLYIKNVEGIHPGLYLYQPVSHTVRKVKDTIPIKDLLILSADMRHIERATVVFFYSYNMRINYLKYGELGLLLAVIEAGSMLQNGHLIATALKLGFCGWGGIKKAAIENTLGLRNSLNHILLAAVSGEVDK